MRILIFALMLGLSVHAWAADFYFTKNNLWFDPTDKETVTAVLDLKGIEHATVQMLLSYYLPPPIFQRIQIEIAEQYGQPFVRATFSNMSHADLVRVSEMLPQFVQPRFGGTTMSPEIPLALRVENLKGHDDFVAAVTGLPLKTIKDIDKAAIKAEKTGKTLVVRYFLDDRKKDDPQDYKELRTANGDAVVTVIPANTYGQMPLSVPGKSVVFHSRSFHGMTILGSLNPGLANSQIAQALTANKYVEALFWNQYAPEALPETHLLANMNLNLANPLILVQQLNQMYPEGWVMKGVNESSSNFSIITDQTKLVEEIEAYSHSDFEQFKAKTYQEMAGYDEDNIYETLQEHKNYFGWRASLYLKNPTRVIIQRKVAIKREFRVEVIGGKVLVKGTIDRHNWLLEAQGKPFEVSSPEEFKKVEEFAQSIIDKLPKWLRETNFAFDIALLKNGKCIAIESNAGSESGFLTNQDTSVVALNNLLRQYPEMKTRHQIYAAGVSNEDQMRYLSERFKIWGIDVNVHYPQYGFTNSGLTSEFKPVEVPAKFVLRSAVVRCEAVF